ncbi:CobW C-terminal domain-containing protein [Haematococcus lacustris]|uniref:CobW C-terminal domain-containing protein n=1 Tax=Haematococcus lacustris TaxID=44745 RepID=A0A699YUL6_HAELA|nr:CobW C-terminal domain-containing protein [Haematococcus lacustris]
MIAVWCLLHGDNNIDSELVVKQEVVEGSRDTVMQLSNGCLCCTVRDDLIQALNRLFDHIVIETTGLANPAPIISSFFMDRSLPDKVKLDGVVTVVDAKHVSRHLDTPKEAGVVNEAVEQIAFADRTLLNKTDLVDTASLGSLEARLQAINKMATITPSQRAQEVGHTGGAG